MFKRGARREAPWYQSVHESLTRRATKKAPLWCERDAWGLIEIKRSPLGYELTFDGGALQGRLDVDEPWVPLSEYAVSMVAASAICERPPREVCVVGVGTASLAWSYQRLYPSAALTLIELRGEVIEGARACLGFDQLLKEGDQLLISPVEEALVELTSDRFDLTAVDIFAPSGMAPALSTPALWSELTRTLSPQGVLCLNLWSSDSERFQHLLSLARAHMSDHHVLWVIDHLEFSNVSLLLAPKGVSREEARLRALSYEQHVRSSAPLTRSRRKAMRSAGLSGEGLASRVERARPLGRRGR